MKYYKGHIILFILVLFTFRSVLIAQSPRFIRERIDVFVHDEYAEVVGTYYFYNPHSKPTNNSFYYPFIVNKSSSYPDSISAKFFRTNQEIEFRKSKEGVHFIFNILPKDTCIYQVYYRQKVRQYKMEYILTSTKKWGRPLEFAEYYVHVPNNLELKDLSYKLKLIEESNSRRIYYLKKKNFMPDKNLVVKWGVRK
jgi:hypothetical protein